MKDFKKITSPELCEKKSITTRADGRENYLRFLKPNDKFSVCNCVIKSSYSKKLITGVKYPRLGWEHVLVRTRNRTPTYKEMIYAKDLFWKNNEIAFQIFPSNSEYVNLEKYTLHLWRFSKISPRQECILYSKVLEQYIQIFERYEYGFRRSILLNDEYFGKRVLVFGEMHWPNWSELYLEKAKFWDEEETVVVFHLNPKIDGNKHYVTILWDGKDIPLPPKEMV